MGQSSGFSSVSVIGLGKVGELVATLLCDAGFEVRAYDARARTGLPFPSAALDVRDQTQLREALGRSTLWCPACRTT